jgi:hypothetical protein
VHGDKFELRNALHCHTPTVGGNQKQIDMKRIVTFLMILALLSCEKEDNIDKENDNWFKIFTSGNSLSKVIKDWDDSYVLAGNVYLLYLPVLIVIMDSQLMKNILLVLLNVLHVVLLILKNYQESQLKGL